MTDSALPTLIEHAMDHSYDGEQQYFSSPLYPKDVVYTRGVRYIAEHGKA
jgi:hypothetical protein